MRSTADQERGLGRWTIKTGVWILAGLLVLTIALVFSAREETVSYPSITNTKASGYAAFAELLRRDGYEVALDRSPRPKYAKTDVVIAPVRPLQEMDFEAPFGEPKPEARYDALLEHVRQGGTVIELIHWEQFRRGSEEAQAARTVVAANDPKRAYRINMIYNPFEPTTFDIVEASYGAWFLGEYSFVYFTRVGDGLLVTVGEGLPATNRFLGEEQNAAFFLDIVRSAAPAGSRIVFDEAGIGNADAPTVTNTLGRWAEFARWQALALFVIVVFTLSRRFGLPETERRRVKSSRELFDAISDVFRRTANTGLALDNLLIECDHRLRSVLNAPSSLKRSEVLRLVPAVVRDQYLVVSELANANAPPRKSVEHAAKLLSLVEAFEQDSRAARGLRRP